MFISNYLGFWTQERWQLLSASALKECKYIEKKVIRHINDNLGDFLYSSGEFYEE